MKAPAGTLAMFVLVLAACGLRHGQDIGATETTGAAVPAMRTSPSVSLGDEGSPLPPTEGAKVSVAATEGDAGAGGEVPAYNRPPLHESMGSSYSDVGMPYPLPDVPAAGMPQTRGAPSGAFPPSVSVDEAFPQGDSFPETTFGPPAPSPTTFPETTFGRDESQ